MDVEKDLLIVDEVGVSSQQAGREQTSARPVFSDPVRICQVEAIRDDKSRCHARHLYAVDEPETSHQLNEAVPDCHTSTCVQLSLSRSVALHLLLLTKILFRRDLLDANRSSFSPNYCNFGSPWHLKPKISCLGINL
ncbi:hypothetical protein HELRODRAFT_182488 [Helobdella robusta]|uniref:Uncharacterized protein n=1 Tax=Helobdella robusta TaxID=6412 RepID=T1FI94_HELRO|nr:hypothetical protein HELRODRAFT_182488 [Helobdella robusta]ESN90901.1 hypothetical protein HELRODRAFT_182488 [Helobdella robusta]